MAKQESNKNEAQNAQVVGENTAKRTEPIAPDQAAIAVADAAQSDAMPAQSQQNISTDAEGDAAEGDALAKEPTDADFDAAKITRYMNRESILGIASEFERVAASLRKSVADADESEAQEKAGTGSEYTYVSRQGESFADIAETLKVPYAELAAANPNVNPLSVVSGTGIKLPEKSRAKKPVADKASGGSSG